MDYVPSIFSHTPVVKKTPQILKQKLDMQSRLNGREENKKKSTAALALLALSNDAENEVPVTASQASPLMKDSFTQTEIHGPTFESMLSLSDEQSKVINEQALLIQNYISVSKDLQIHISDLNNEIHKLKIQVTQLEEENNELSKRVSTSFGHQFVRGDDARTSYYTGFPSFTTFLTVFKLAHKHVSRKNTKLTPEDEMLLTLVKLKHNAGMEDLGYRFGISMSLVTKIFHVWLDALYCTLGGLIMWPQTDFVQLPDVFNNDQFKTVKCVIDCTEIFIERPRGLKARAQTYSNYKRRNTVKILIGISPSGCVTFVSKSWGGRVSDKKITLESGFLDKLLPGDTVMADRAFTMKEDFAMRGAKLIVPAFTKEKRQLSTQEVEESRQMSKARIHVY